MSAETLFQPGVRCPKCGRPPRLGYTRAQLEKWAPDHPAAVVQTYQCAYERRPGLRCNAIYRIRAGDLHGATVLDPGTIKIQG